MYISEFSLLSLFATVRLPKKKTKKKKKKKKKTHLEPKASVKNPAFFKLNTSLGGFRLDQHGNIESDRLPPFQGWALIKFYARAA